MAKLTRDEVLNLARLARLHLTDDEINSFQKDISSILEYVEQLQSVNLGNIKPTYQVTGLTNSTREDVIFEYNQKQNDLLKNAPDSETGLIKVRRML